MVGKERVWAYDILRIIAAFSVVMLHSAAEFWYVLDVHQTEWVIANAYDSLFRFGVPIFVMISGALFLQPEYKLDIKRLFGRNIFRLAVLYVVWSAIYGLYDCTRWNFSELRLEDILIEIYSGRYHLWFLPMLVGIYLVLPVLKSWIESASKENIEYFLALFFVLQVCTETIKALAQNNEISYLLDLCKAEMACGYLGYFVLGYYIAHIGISSRIKKLLYIMVIPSMVLNVILGTWLAQRANQPLGAIYDSYGLFTFILTVALFVYITDNAKKWNFSSRCSKAIEELSADTLGVYVMHIGVIEIFESMGIHNMIIPNMIGIPVQAVSCFVLCLLLSAVLRRIPFIGKYIC